MAMSEAARQRLREHAAKNKGRTNLMGLDRTLAGVALDWAQENPERCAAWVFRADGGLEYAVGQFHEGLYLSGIKTRYDEPGKLQSRTYLKLPWVRLSYAPDYLKEEFRNRFGSRRIVFHVRGIANTGEVFPIGPVAEFLRFVWPADRSQQDDLQLRARKYLTGYSENYIQRWPGAGAKLRMHTNHPFYPNGVAEVAGVSENGSLIDLRYENGEEWQVSRLPERWTVIG